MSGVELSELRPARPGPARSGRLLGLDLGARRIGVAVCDSGWTLASGVTTVIRQGDRPAEHRAIAALVEEYEAIGVIVGMPLSMSGDAGPAALAVGEEVDQLRQHLAVPVDTVDERLTTVQAAGSLRAGGRSAKRQRNVIDREAAAGILQTWLDQHREGAR